ncbi:MAG: hypothetical protein LKM33_01480 [Bacteroidales bacterium]|jgi:hypothetical protein|nr:hypothetical protein [Bacteroidales bacterium]
MKNILKNFLAVAITAALFVFSANVAAAQMMRMMPMFPAALLGGDMMLIFSQVHVQ